MKPEQWQKIVSLAEAAAELGNEEERTAFLDEACAEDETLRNEVESLLSSDKQAENFIEAPAFGIAAELIAGDQVESIVGREIGLYKIIDLLGVGGMGEVYLAQDTRLGRKVALKFLPSYFMIDKTRVRRFEQEAIAASALNHPNILTIYEIGQSDGAYFMATEFVEGKTLRQHIESVQMTCREVLDVAIQVASALAAAHQAGIVHRDIKPENIMLRPDGYIKVLDFGLAKITRRRQQPKDSDGAVEDTSYTDAGVVMGTPHYMSPEQARGLNVDRRTDIFSLGVVTYEMLTSRKPFEGETASHVIVAILEKDPEPISQFSHDIPADLERIINIALSKDTVTRYQTVTDLIVELKSLRERLESKPPTPHDPKQNKNAISREHLKDRSIGDPAASSSDARRTRDASIAAYLTSEISRRKKSILLGLVTMVVAATSVAYFWSLESRKTINSLAILPFINASSDPNVNYLSDGIADNLTNSLSRLPNLTVISSSAVSRYKARDANEGSPDVQAIGREFNVQALVVGKVMQQGDSVYINVELVDARDNRHLWGERYERKLADILSMQEDITTRISENLKLELTGQEKSLLTKRYTESAEAYQLYLRGRQYWNMRTGEGLRKSIELFDQAIRVDPNYALAYAGLADSFQLLSFYSGLPPTEYFSKARAAAERAIQLDDSLAEAHTTLAYVRFYYDWDWTGAEAEFKRALELNPNYATAHQWYGEFLENMGRPDESLSERKKALTLDPLSPIISTEIGFSYFDARQYDRAVEEFRRATEIYPSFAPAHSVLAMAWMMKGMYDEALVECQKAIALDNNNADLLIQLAQIYAMSGRSTDAQRVLAQIKRESNQRYFQPSHIATVYWALNDSEQTFAWLEKAYEERDRGLVWLRIEPWLDSLRSEPRFGDLMKRMNFPQ